MKTVRHLFVAVGILATGFAQAETSLTCWNTHASVRRPILKARIMNQTRLTEVEFDFSQAFLPSYFIEERTEIPNKPGKFITKRGSLTNPTARLVPEEIENNRSPYNGNNQYTWEFGRYSMTRPGSRDRRVYTARLIAPKDLSNENLRDFRFKSRPNERTNVVLIMNPSATEHQYGDNFLRMFCTSD